MDLRGLSLICAGLGIAEEDVDGNRVSYTKSEYCSDNMKDLLRFLRRDDPQSREVFKQVCKWNTVSKDLIPIIEHCQDEHPLVLNAVKVLVFLTMPVDPSSSDIPQQIEYLWGLKSSITYSNTIAVIVSLLESPLENLENESFSEDDWKLVELILTLIRNILAIQDVSFQQKAWGSASQFLSLRDKFLELLLRENVMDLILVITQHGGASYLRQNNLLLLEIFHYIFLGHKPELIARVHVKGFKVDEDTEASLDNLKSIMEKEKEKRKLSLLQNVARHSQFSGTFTRLTMNGSKTVLKGNPIRAPCATLHKPHKVHRGPVKKIVWDHGRLPSTTDKILELVHDFVNQFLAGGYNDLMQSICEDIEKEHPSIQKSDIVVFFQVAQFVTSFQYHKFLNLKPNMDTVQSGACSEDYADNTLFKGDMCGPIAASMNESMFLLVVSRWRNAFEGLKETNDYKFLSSAGSLMKTMIHMLDLVLYESPKNSREPQTARILLYKLFYDQTEEGMTQFLLNLIKLFDTHKQPKSDLADLVEMVNVIVKLMEALQARGTLRVSKKTRKGRKLKPMSDKKQTENELSGDFAIEQERTAIPNTGKSDDMGFSCEASLVDASSDGKGAPKVMEVDGPEMPVSQTMDHEDTLAQSDSKKSDNVKDDIFNSMSDSSGDEQPAATDEVDFKMSTLISAFANNHIIQNLCWLLKFYRSNSSSTNQCIITFLQRITDDLELSPMLYQLSLLTIFYEILAEQKSCPCEEYANIVSFLTALVKKMLKKMKTQPLLFVEILSWKSRRECHFINAEYLSHQIGKLKEQSRGWGNVSVNGDMGSSHSKDWVPRSIADALGEDEADVVISHELGHNNISGESDDDISNSEINKQKLSSNMETLSEHEAEKVSARKRRFVMSDELEIKIKDLYEKFKDERRCSRLIAEALKPDNNLSPALVTNKLKQLGLVIGTKKRMRYAEVVFPAAPNQSCEDVRGPEREISPKTLSPYTRKSMRGFSEEQETLIKTLFAKFKDQKRCSYMIAHALGADSAYTAAQISRKLKQLGLCRQKRTKVDQHLRDEEVEDLSRENTPAYDDETLLSLRNRSKNKQNTRLDGSEQSNPNTEGTLSEDDSDDKILISLLKNKNKQRSRVGGLELPNPNTEGMSLGDPYGDKVVSSALNKTRKLRKAKEEKLQRSTTSKENSGGGLTEDATERGGSELVQMNDASSGEDVERDELSEGEVSGNVNEEELDVREKHMEELADLWDDGDMTNAGQSSNNAVSRRKFMMVDDDE